MPISNFFVSLPLIVRGEIRAVEGNLCLYPNMQNLDNFEVDIRYEFVSLICIQPVFLLVHIGWESVSILLRWFSRACILEIGANKFPGLLMVKFAESRKL